MKAYIAGVQDLSTIDYPGKLCCVVFFAGCNLRCRYCFNSRFLEFRDEFLRSMKDVKENIVKNLPLIEAITLSGGEPLLQQEALIDISTWAKNKGLSVGVETNGTEPRVLEKALNMKLLDFVAMDVKASFKKYKEVVQTNDQIVGKVRKCIEILKQSGIEHVFRTTFVPGLVDVDEIETIGKIVDQDKWEWQRFRYDLGEILDKQLLGRDFSQDERKTFQILSKQFRNVVLRF